MKIGYYIKKLPLQGDARIEALLGELSAAGAELYRISGKEDVLPGSAMLLSFGGDGTFLSAAHRVSEAGVPILGVNFGRMGFLSENRIEDVARAILDGKFSIEERNMLQVVCRGSVIPGLWPYALNEAGLHRIGAEMIGVDVTIDGEQLPTYWADGLLVATSSGSTAYSLSAGGPICTPDANVELLTPVAPHNLNLRPLVLPSGSVVELSAQSRLGEVVLSLDNRNYRLPAGTVIEVKEAPFKLKRVKIGKSNFIDALRSRFFWGQDVRNINE